MKSRRTFLKILAGIGAFVIPWTVLPEILGQKMNTLLGRASVNMIISPGFKEKGREKPSSSVLSRKALEDIQALINPEMQGRRAGTAGETRALVYLEEQVRDLNLKPLGDNKYWQTFSIPSMQERIINGRALFRPDENDSYRMPAANILAELPGENKNETIIISAHFDHLGLYNGKLYPGANDNASGVGCVLEVMRRLVNAYYEGTRPKINIVLAFWGAEEMGFLGSKHFVANPSIPLSQIKAVINYDTVGNGEKKDFILWSSGDSPLVNMIKDSVTKNGALCELIPIQGHQSDESSFIGAGVPAVTLLSREWLIDNHTPEDLLNIINEEKLKTACAVLYDIVRKLAY